MSNIDTRDAQRRARMQGLLDGTFLIRGGAGTAKTDLAAVVPSANDIAVASALGIDLNALQVVCQNKLTDATIALTTFQKYCTDAGTKTAVGVVITDVNT